MCTSSYHPLVFGGELDLDVRSMPFQHCTQNDGKKEAHCFSLNNSARCSVMPMVNLPAFVVHFAFPERSTYWEDNFVCTK